MVAISETNIKLWLANGSVLGDPHIESLIHFVDENPFYPPTQAILAKAFFNTNDERFENQLHKAALCNSDRQWLYNFIHQTPVLNTVVIEHNKVEVPIETLTTPAIPPIVEATKSPLPEVITEEIIDQGVKIDPPSIKAPQEIIEEEPIKINISQGDGEVVNGLEETNLEPATPKLHIEKEEVTETLPVKTQESKISLKKQKPKTKESHSFLDWLDYTTFNRKKDNTVSEIDKENKEADAVKDLEKETTAESFKGSVTKTAEILEKFIANKPKPGEIKLEIYSPEEKSVASDSTAFIPISETLAEVYVEQGEIEMAIEIYEKLKLKFPEKSTYFADLIQKLNI